MKHAEIRQEIELFLNELKHGPKNASFRGRVTVLLENLNIDLADCDGDPTSKLQRAQAIGRANPIPTRHRVSGWRYGTCQRCLNNDVQDGDIVVRIYGIGWWHDRCYRQVNPTYYDGIEVGA